MLELTLAMLCTDQERKSAKPWAVALELHPGSLPGLPKTSFWFYANSHRRWFLAHSPRNGVLKADYAPLNFQSQSPDIRSSF
jgi:hypothetical protein